MPTLSRNIIISVVLAIAAGAAIFAYTSQVRSSADRTDNTISVLVATRPARTWTMLRPRAGSSSGRSARARWPPAR